jgi:tripartite ATP-independent transporter DctM subunit
MSLEFMAPLMFAGLVVFLLLGYPVAFSLAANGLLFGLIGIAHGNIEPALLQALPERVLGIMANSTLLAIPFFTFMGLILERSGMAEDLLDTVGQLFGAIRGGVAYAVVFVGALLAATTGVVAASVLAMGLISLPVMMRYGYANWLSTGVIAASGTLAQIIPPSLVLIVLADQMGASVGDFYEGALIPGLSLAVLYGVWVAIVSLVKPHAAPGCPPEARTLFGGALVAKVFTSMIPPLVLIFLVLGTIFLGVATPTEGGAMGASGALIMAVARRRLSWRLLKQAMDTTAKLSTFVVFILVGARVFSLTFYGVSGHIWVEHLLTSLPGGQLGFLIVVNALIFFLAFFLDFFELSFIIIPLIGPAADKLGIDLIWLGVLLGVNMQTSFMHPPFGFALFYLRSVAPAKDYVDRLSRKLTKGVTTGQIYWGAVPFVIIQVLMIGLVIAFPQMVLVYKAGEKAYDINTIQIIVPEEAPLFPREPGAKGAARPRSGAQEQDDAEKALERALGGGADQAAPKEEPKAPDTAK